MNIYFFLSTFSLDLVLKIEQGVLTQNFRADGFTRSLSIFCKHMSTTLELYPIRISWREQKPTLFGEPLIKKPRRRATVRDVSYCY